MNQDEDRIDRLVRSVLAANPSPEFESRIRTRIRTEARGHRRAFNPMLLGSCLVAAMVIALTLSGPPKGDSGFVEKASQPVHLSIHANAPAKEADDSRPSPASTAVPVEQSHRMKTVIVAPGDSLTNVASSALGADALTVPPLEWVSLEASAPPLAIAALPPGHDLPQFEIQPFSLWASNEGVTE
jgi:hypothetical protein